MNPSIQTSMYTTKNWLMSRSTTSIEIETGMRVVVDTSMASTEAMGKYSLPAIAKSGLSIQGAPMMPVNMPIPEGPSP